MGDEKPLPRWLMFSGASLFIQGEEHCRFDKKQILPICVHYSVFIYILTNYYY
jgi:hypothetical protein